MSKMKWDQIGERLYETGIEQCALFLPEQGVYSKGFPWNGITAVNESPSGAEPSPIYADNTKYLSLMSNEEFGCTIEAYTYPDEFAECDGSKEIAPGVYANQQSRRMFGLAYKSLIGNDVDDTEHGYKLHLIYGAKAAPSEKSYATVNDSPEAITFSWEASTTPVAITKLVGGKKLKPTSCLVFDSTKTDPEKMKALEAILYGVDADIDSSVTAVEPRLPLPDEVIELMAKVSG